MGQAVELHGFFVGFLNEYSGDLITCHKTNIRKQWAIFAILPTLPSILFMYLSQVCNHYLFDAINCRIY